MRDEEREREELQIVILLWRVRRCGSNFSAADGDASNWLMRKESVRARGATIFGQRKKKKGCPSELSGEPARRNHLSVRGAC